MGSSGSRANTSPGPESEMARIRPALPEDADAIAHVHVLSWQSTYRGLIPQDILDDLSVEQRKDWWQRTITGPSQNEVLVVDDAGQLVGFAGYGSERAGNRVYRGELLAIYLLEQHQRKGWGRSLVRAAAQGLLKRGITSMLVWVLSDNPSRYFYEKLEAVYLRQKPLEIGGVLYQESAYGWADIHSLAAAI